MKLTIKNSSQVAKAVNKKLKMLREAYVESGVFIEQGMHPTAEMSFTDLAYMQAKGFNKIPSRDIRPSVLLSMSSLTFKSIYGKELSKFFNGKSGQLTNSLDSIGYSITSTSKDFFGVPSMSNPMNSSSWANAKGGNTPLVNKGHLMDAWSYKTSEDGSLKGAL